MALEPRARPPGETLRLARKAGDIAGVTRLGEVSHFAVPGIPVYQAVRPFSRSLTVSQGKGLTPSAAMVGALLESVEFWAAETLVPPTRKMRLADMLPGDRALWSGSRHPLALTLDPGRDRHWLAGVDLASGDRRMIPFDQLSLDFSRPRLGTGATSNGLACGNTDTEAQASGIAELLEHHGIARFDMLSPQEQLTRQVLLSTIDDPLLVRMIRRVHAAGFQLRAWSLGDETGIATFLCLMIETRRQCDNLTPSAGSGCHPDKRVALLRAILEAVQSHATHFAGARDDIAPIAYTHGREQEFVFLLRALGFGKGSLGWSDIPTQELAGTAAIRECLLRSVQSLTEVPVVAFEHRLPVEGVSLWHCLAPGLMDNARAEPPRSVAAVPIRIASAARPAPRRAVLFAGPSIHGLAIDPAIDLRPPAACGDLSALLADPPETVGLIDGVFRTCRTVWHKEILSLLAAGVRVVGGASLGALRAAELDCFGMEGVGRIYQAYREDRLLRDDAVLFLHAPAQLSYAPLTMALVDAEEALERVDIPARDRRAMQRIVRTTDYTDRTWPRCLALFVSRTGRDFPLSAETLERVPSIKRQDAEAVVQAMLTPPPTVRPACAEPARTCYYEPLLTIAAQASAAGPS
ncbi:YcaO-like family protein [Novosphingobium sp. BL-8A]|uniref:YcaO-like family protein n=1 Tax=Novosphingobium sp. BL-8A TaxID=3127639 RepID=UPI003757E7C4